MAEAGVQKPHPPVLLGGGTPATLERVVDYCDGWLPIGVDRKTVLEGIADIERRAQAKGRPMSTISISVFGARPDRETLDGYERAGVERVLLRLPSAGRDQTLPLLDQYAKLVAFAPA